MSDLDACLERDWRARTLAFSTLFTDVLAREASAERTRLHMQQQQQQQLQAKAHQTGIETTSTEPLSSSPSSHSPVPAHSAGSLSTTTAPTVGAASVASGLGGDPHLARRYTNPSGGSGLSTIAGTAGSTGLSVPFGVGQRRPVSTCSTGSPSGQSQWPPSSRPGLGNNAGTLGAGSAGTATSRQAVSSSPLEPDGKLVVTTFIADLSTQDSVNNWLAYFQDNGKLWLVSLLLLALTILHSISIGIISTFVSLLLCILF
ncbi:unnamed protein product [Protopolystoma xenopodis]|uniref:Uncharacterized protein n=1 Tax=Protopolystoma xenopodis TaxID=117903 RepID=A0A448XS29_9PLAT|nr:unnamed protein product [Protopolystoma xenopodis]